ncbi:myosin heavy chain [Photobacterium aphoticum]|uniref:Myosin heavy chain n=1 Tax=Photobacterium aphoticum TaxID=754436 RepID=A0A090QLM0_9GAMM|nr:myosin heavy chain [Photobacterium aphoticum]
MLNAIRLFLLPEENFKNSKKKFGFSDKEGKFFSDDESFEHYFPSASSFLILECDNYLGGRLPHCQILYRGSADKLDYRRMFTSLRYEQIRHHFWDANAGEDGVGGRAEGLSPTKVQAFLKREDKYFKTLVRSAAIKELIYANQLLDIDAMRFCLFPLNATDDANVDAFRALVRLLFDMKTGSDTVRLAVANIIESQKKERKDALNFDIDALLNTMMRSPVGSVC